MAISGSRSGRMTELQVAKIQKEISPERKKIWNEPPANRMKVGGKVPVVYYLCRNGQLEHPHFMEVEVSSSHGIFLRDVIGRLNVLRGIGMADLYSWSCKRSYKNRFVWHDLSEDDIIFPVNGGREYVLKGSELLKLPSSERPIAGDVVDYTPASERRQRNQSCSSIDFSSTEYTVYKSDSSSTSAAADASTQTDDDGRRPRPRPTQQEVEKNSKTEHSGEVHHHREEIEIEISPPPSDSSPETLEALMKTDDRPAPPPDYGGEVSAADVKNTRVVGKSSVVMQLMSCSSFKDWGSRPGGLRNLLSHYKVRAAHGGRRMKLKDRELKRSTSCHDDSLTDSLPRI